MLLLVYVYHECTAGAWEARGHLAPGVKLQEVEGCLIMGAGTDPGCPARAVSAFNHLTNSPASHVFVLFFLRWVFLMQYRLALNSRSSCLSVLDDGIIDVYHHSWFINSFKKFPKWLRQSWEPQVNRWNAPNTWPFVQCYLNVCPCIFCDSWGSACPVSVGQRMAQVLPNFRAGPDDPVLNSVPPCLPQIPV